MSVCEWINKFCDEIKNNFYCDKKFSNKQKNENNQSTRKMKKIIKVQIKWMNVFVSDDYV